MHCDVLWPVVAIVTSVKKKHSTLDLYQYYRQGGFGLFSTPFMPLGYCIVHIIPEDSVDSEHPVYLQIDILQANRCIIGEWERANLVV